MMGPFDPAQDHEQSWEDRNHRSASLFNDLKSQGEFQSTDLISEMNHKLMLLDDLCGRLSFSMRELGQVVKIKSERL